MIINVRGTSGAGKSTLVKRVMERYDQCVPVMLPQPVVQTLFGDRPTGRERIGGYLCVASGMPPLYVMGSYEAKILCGCDVRMGWGSTRDELAEEIRAHDDARQDVLYEGLIASEVSRVSAMHADGRRVLVVALDVTIDQCLESVRARRAGVISKPLSETKTRAKHKEISSQIERLRAQGVDVRVLTREDAYCTVCRELGWD